MFSALAPELQATILARLENIARQMGPWGGEGDFWLETEGFRLTCRPLHDEQVLLLTDLIERRRPAFG